MSHHVIITGTGRAGTTFLMQLLTALGFDTGFTKDTPIDINARAGLEKILNYEDAPYIVKSPFFCDHMKEVLENKNFIIDHVIIPVRDIKAAALSRKRVVERTKSNLPPSKITGGLWGTDNFEKQEDILLNKFYNLMLALSASKVPLILLQYPKLIKDRIYLFEKLLPILPSDLTVSMFLNAFDETVKPEWINAT